MNVQIQKGISPLKISSRRDGLNCYYGHGLTGETQEFVSIDVVAPNQVAESPLMILDCGHETSYTALIQGEVVGRATTKAAALSLIKTRLKNSNGGPFLIIQGNHSPVVT